MFCRYQIILHGSHRAQNRRHVVIVILFTTTTLLYVTGYFLLCHFLGWSAFPMIDVCTKGQYGVLGKSKIMAAYVVPKFVSTLVPAFYDLRTYLFLVKRQNNLPTDGDNVNHIQGRKLHIYLQVPLRATLTSTFMVAPFIVVAALVSSLAHTREIQVYLVSLIVTGMVCLKFPVISTIIFKNNEMNRAEDHKAMTQQRREIELQHARERLNQIKRRQAQPQVEQSMRREALLP